MAGTLNTSLDKLQAVTGKLERMLDASPFTSECKPQLQRQLKLFAIDVNTAILEEQKAELLQMQGTDTCGDAESVKKGKATTAAKK